MDAKPQRPRAVHRVPRDENAPALNPPNNNNNNNNNNHHHHHHKTLHQRNKSTPALSTAAAAAVTGMAKGQERKRTAFGDVSNTAMVRSAKDDHGVANNNAKLGATKTLEKTTTAVALARPPQRNTAGTATKPSLMTSASLNNLNPATTKPAAAAVDRATGNSRNFVTRRNTVFRDQSLQPVPEADDQPVLKRSGWHHHQHANAVKAGSTTATSASTASAHRPVSTHGIPSAVRAVALEPAENEPAAPPQNTGRPRPPDHEESEAPPEEEATTQDQVKRDRSRKETDPSRGIISGTLGEMPSTDVIYEYPPDVSDPPEEYWEAEYDGGHDEDGYVTTESQRSRGENNTTEAATTVVLFPKHTHEVKRELAHAKQVVEATRTAEDFEDECWDTSMVAEYGNEIFQYMRDLERKLLPNPHYMDNQAEIQWSMRSVLMDWLVQVHLRFSLLPETLFLCVNYIDRFLSCKIVSLGKLQLVGATAIFIAAKYEEINCPSVQEIVYMVDSGYSVEEILKAERFMLSMLQFELGWPGPMSFLRRISKADDYDLETRSLSKYLLEVTVMDERFVGSPPSFIAAGAHCLSRLMLRKGGWTPEHVYYSNYTYSQLSPLVSLILECCDVPQKHHPAIYEKYTDKRFKRASYFVESELSKGFTLPDDRREVSAGRVGPTFDSHQTFKRN